MYRRGAALQRSSVTLKVTAGDLILIKHEKLKTQNIIQFLYVTPALKREIRLISLYL